MTKKSVSDSELRTGTQSIERVVELLRVVASRGSRGMRIGEVVATAGLTFRRSPDAFEPN